MTPLELNMRVINKTTKKIKLFCKKINKLL